MFAKTKIALVAAFVVGSASAAAAQNNYHAIHQEAELQAWASNAVPTVPPQVARRQIGVQYGPGNIFAAAYFANRQAARSFGDQAVWFDRASGIPF